MSIVDELLCELTGAEAATVVNNNAAAVFLLLNTLAPRKSSHRFARRADRDRRRLSRAGHHAARRGQAGRGRYHQSHPPQGLRRESITSRTAMLMKVHASNYAIHGFTHAVPEAELAALAHQNNLPFVVDLGSGTLSDLSAYGLPHEPTPREAIAAGADLVSFSGDKLLGGPQAGLLVGRRDLIARIKKNPLKRCLRVGKLTLAALEAVLALYRDPDRLHLRVTAVRQLTRPEDEIRAAAGRLLPALQTRIGRAAGHGEIVALKSQIGSGSLPVDRLHSAGFAIRPQGKKGGVLNRIEGALRGAAHPCAR
jgi:L-seryl-tRNA(Ser) seleniumtransferase